MVMGMWFPLVIKRATPADIPRINEILNHPKVFPWISVHGQEALDATDILENTDNIVLLADHGCFIFICTEPAIYQVHTNFIDGTGAMEAAKQAAWYMFINTGCVEIQTQVPVDNVPADKLTQRMGFRVEFRRKACFPRESGPVDTKFYTLRIQDWAKQQNFTKSGKWFHERLEEAGHQPDHDDDQAHDHAVGMAVEMMKSGNTAKALYFYNRWARLAWYQPISMIQDDPLILDIGDAVIRYDGDIHLEN